jgi:hypothetical protein
VGNTKQLDMFEMAQKLKELENLIPHIESFCCKYRELFPNTEEPKVEQVNAFQFERLLEDDEKDTKKLRTGQSSKIIGLIRGFNRPLEPIEIKKAYYKMYGKPSDNKQKLYRSIQQGLLYLTHKRKILIQTEDGKYKISETKEVA